MPISHFSTEPLSWFRNHPMDTTTHNSKFQVQNYNGVVSENDYTNNSYSYSDQDRHSAVTSEDQHHHYYRQISHVSGPHHHRNHINCKEPMFEKPLTPSDVGKLNRLVIPKQHAEKYFPLNGNGNGNGAVINDPTSSGGTLLNFEDEAGKSWRFRYSYWNSSQSYVLTKGWSRYVKEKRLDAGDVVFFERHVTCPDRLFIGWRRRAATADGSVQDSRAVSGKAYYGARGAGGYVQDSSSSHSHSHQATALGFTTTATISQFQPDRFHAETALQMQSQNTTLGNTSNNDNNNNSKRRFRLFGVNLECGQPSTPAGGGGDCQTTSSEGSSSFSGQYQQQHLQGPSPTSYNNYIDQGNYHHSQYHYQMDINFPQGVNQMGNRL